MNTGAIFCQLITGRLRAKALIIIIIYYYYVIFETLCLLVQNCISNQLNDAGCVRVAWAFMLCKV